MLPELRFKSAYSTALNANAGWLINQRLKPDIRLFANFLAFSCLILDLNHAFRWIAAEISADAVLLRSYRRMEVSQLDSQSRCGVVHMAVVNDRGQSIQPLTMGLIVVAGDG